MNAKTFYGRKGAAECVPNGDLSEDDNLSEDDEFRQRTEFVKILAEESESLSESDNITDVASEIISETETDHEGSEWDSKDDVPLARVVKKIEETQKITKRAKKITKKPETAKKITKKNKTAKKDKKKEDVLQWQNTFLKVLDEDIIFKGSETLPVDVSQMDQPFQFFKYIFTQEILSYITQQTNLYSVQVRPEKPANISEGEINAFIGICIYMSIVHLPATRSYWNNSMEIPVVSQTMTCNRFEDIKRFLHFNDNTELIPRGQPGYDKLFKIRPFLSKVKDRCLQVPKEEYLAVDEQIIPTKARSTLKQYNPNKPHKWGYKVFVLSGVSGFSYDFDIFTGSTALQAHQPDLGASSNVVVKLTETVPRNENFKVFFDNWFTSIPLLVYLRKEGILPLGTARLNRLPNCGIEKKEIKKRDRGSFVEKVARVDGVDISVVCWRDNKVVTVVSTYVGSQPTSDVRRFSKKDQSYIIIPRPKCIGVYNSYMGGVDLLDSMLGYYRIRIRSKKWYMRIFFHFIDMICVNAWILWRRAVSNSEIYLPLSEFKLALAEVLTGSNTVSRKRGRPSTSLQSQLDLKKRKYPFSEIPAKELRTDNRNHLPKWNGDRQRCKFPDCSGKSFVSCEKCKVYLCLNKDRNCFYEFHTE